jgi:hypothetical protein
MEPRVAEEAPTAVLRCPGCRDKVVVERASEVVVHNAILRIERGSGRVSAKCRRCKAWVDVPLSYQG